MVATRQWLSAHAAELLPAWRARYRPDPPLPPRARAVLEQLLLPPAVAVGDDAAALAALDEQVRYFARRLAKLSVPLAQVNHALTCCQPLAIAHLRRRWSEPVATAAQYRWQQRTAMAVAEVYVAAKSNAVHGLLAVLDAELGAAGITQLLERLLVQAARLFPINWGEIMLVAPDGKLRHAAAYGLAPGAINTGAGAGEFFQQIARRATPGFLLDAASDARLAQPYFRALKVKSLWAVPLVRHTPHTEVLGVLAVAFDRAYECLPQERELLLALAERSTLALERTRMIERLNRQQQHLSELTRRLLDAQDEERRRVSRDLHDETGQALMTLRMYFEMALRERSRAAARRWLERGVSLVDLSVAELRRILAELSPLLLDELGLEAALRLELRKLRLHHHWRARFQFTAGPARLDPALEILVYRVVLEGLRNIGRHAQAHQVHLKIVAGPGELAIRLRDDGVGLPAPAPIKAALTLPSPARPAPRFGLAGMRERVRLAGGRLELLSNPGRGLQISIRIPLPSSQAREAS